ncbi:hypothetical protein GOP47_0024929 [Adiantum capillus-veneris]|uniref:Uncharacterized protein n=1 Tax=Adiantum capillus-veneris TaxID=13818 RepID=A0A9D4U4X5_ADICA|nr:hypothetical protein GOP47_0024929 [Adiantum capillus-veneris]
MGNCQAAEMAGALVEVPGGRVERVVMDMQSSFSAQRLMSAYPGYFVALMSSSSIVHPLALPSTPSSTSNPAPLHSFKLLASDAPLRSGHRYRLISFEEVLTCFSQQGPGAYAKGFLTAVNAHKPLSSKHHHLTRDQPLNNHHVVKIGC